MGVKGRQGGRSVEGYHAIPAAADGDGEVQEKSAAGGLDVENGYHKLAASRPLMSWGARVS